MDMLLSKVTQQAMNYAIRSGVAITASYAMRQSSRLLKSVPKSNERDELLALQETLRNKIRIISPAIDMIELITARGNTSLESAVSLTKSLRFDIQALGQRLAKAAVMGERDGETGSNTNAKLQNEAEIRSIIKEIRKMIARLEDAIPSISLAIATSGAKLSTDFPSTVSPTRFAQASNFLSNGDLQYSMTPDEAVQIGPTFTLSVYMLFAGNIRPEDEQGIRETTWKEVMHKARVKLRRVPMDLAFGNMNRSHSNSLGSESAEGDNHIPAGSQVNEFAYQLMIVEDLDDERVHDFDEEEAQPGSLDEVELAGIREYVPIHQLSKIFYADTGKVLNIGSEGETNNPVLLLKRDVNAIPPRRMMDRGNEYELYDDSAQDEQATSDGPPSDGVPEEQTKREPWALPPGLDPEWMAFEVYTEPPEDSEEEDDSQLDRRSENTERPSRSASLDPQVVSSLSNLHLMGDKSQNFSTRANPAASSLLPQQPFSNSLLTTQPAPWAHLIRTSLSLLEVLLRLASLQQFQQQSHLSVTDELLNFFLDESATTGAGGDEGYRQRLRVNARRRVGWDPYDESPIKRRGEEYQYRNGGDGEYAYSPRWETSEREREEYFLRSRENTPASPSPTGGFGNRSAAGGFRSPLAPRTQTRSMTGLSSSPATSTSVNDTPPSLPTKNKPKSSKGRPAFLNKPTVSEERRGSPLRPQTGVSDEGIGTSPGSSSLAGRLDGEGGREEGSK
ncbi:MAG: hypothetical protein Q9160_002056 [Pyrenula sp. 1 TL-2023]